MKRHAGFTWIELVLILAVIGILGAMAIPGIQDTMLKKHVKEGLDLASVAKGGVQSYWKANGEMPPNNAKAGVPPKDKIVGSFKLCVDVDGKVSNVTRLKSTGFEAYDKKILTEMRTNWAYRPYQVNGKTVPVCTAVTFIYSQAAPTPPTKKP